MYLRKAFLHILPVICTLAQVDRSEGLIDVRLSDGPSQYVGTIEYSEDGMTRHTTCGNHLFLSEVKVICRQLGFQGANAVIRNSPFKSGQAASYFSCGTGDQASLDDCIINSPCSPDVQPLGGAACYDNRYLGCFRDNRNGERVLPDNHFVSNDMTIEKCIQYCKNNTENVYAGVEDGNKCYCGDANADYDRFGPLGDDGCQFSCAGYRYSSCGGHDGIAVFNLSVSLPSGTTVSMASVALPSGATELISKPSDTSSLMTTTDQGFIFTSREAQSQGNASKIGLYAAAGGGGGAFLVIIIVIIIVVFVTCKQRQANKRSPVVDELTTINVDSEKGRQTEREDPCYENKDVEKEREYQNMNEVDHQEYFNFPERSEDKQITYMNSTGENDMTQVKPNPAALYAMPDLSAKSSKARHVGHAPPEQSDDPSTMYAMPDRQAKTAHHPNGSENKNDFSAMYATSTKTRPETIGMEASSDAGALYALPDKHFSTGIHRGAGNTTPQPKPSIDDAGLLYAIPDKNRGDGKRNDETVMVENELYSFA